MQPALALALALAVACSSDRPVQRNAEPSSSTSPATAAGSGSHTQESTMDLEKLKTSPKLSLIIDTHLAMPVAYGNRWNAKVKQVVAGELADAEISLTTFGNHSYDGHFRGDEVQLPVTFVKLDHQPPAFAGFVAANGTVWMIWSVGT